MQVWHEGLGTFREIKGRDSQVVEQKANAQLRKWEETWARRQEAEMKRAAAEAAALEKAETQELADEQTSEAQSEIADARSILVRGIEAAKCRTWEGLKPQKLYPQPEPVKPMQTNVPPEPQKEDQKYTPELSIWAKWFGIGKLAAIDKADNLFLKDHRQWEEEKNAIVKAYQVSVADYANQHKTWTLDRNWWLEHQANVCREMDSILASYNSQEPEGVTEFFDRILTACEYPEWCPRDWNLDYAPSSKTLIIESVLPNREDLPRLKEVKYVRTRNELREIMMSDTEFNKLYDDVLYQITLRTFNEIFLADTQSVITGVVFNGLVHTTDRATGQNVSMCILSCLMSKSDHAVIDFAAVDSRACFRGLKGIGSSKLHAMVAVPPIARIDREDTRFVDAHSVCHALEESVNIAAMDWLEFEHLVREIFEKEFSSVGGEVKITRASRDHGVDAIVFDPDPIRGGKIVLQAKRYVNSVDVAAVRDLYGTVINEGATKGILITTSDYGPDAYGFAKDKPITLLNGSNLLYMLHRHGYKAKIDMADARDLMSK